VSMNFTQMAGATTTELSCQAAALPFLLLRVSSSSIELIFSFQLTTHVSGNHLTIIKPHLCRRHVEQ
jgi:hypothetical protein